MEQPFKLSHVVFQLFPLQKTDRVITFLANKDIQKVKKGLLINDFLCQPTDTICIK